MSQTVEEKNNELAKQLEEANQRTAQAQAKADEAIKAKEAVEAEIKKTKEDRANTLNANDRLAKSKEAEKVKNEELEKNLDVLRKQTEEFKNFIVETEKATKEAAYQAKKDLLTKGLEKAGFSSADLLVNEFNIDETTIEEGVIVGFDDKIKELKEKRPELYTDGAAIPATGQSVIFTKQDTGLTETLSKIENKLKEGKDITNEEMMFTMFGHLK